MSLQSLEQIKTCCQLNHSGFAAFEVEGNQASNSESREAARAAPPQHRQAGLGASQQALKCGQLACPCPHPSVLASPCPLLRDTGAWEAAGSGWSEEALANWAKLSTWTHSAAR